MSGAETKNVPRYRAIAEAITRDIFSGALTAGTRLPPERKMAADYGVAIGTLRHALSELTELGLIRRRQGSGNFVTGKLPETAPYPLFRLELTDGGGNATWEVLALDQISGPVPIADIEGDSFWRFRRLQRLDGIPVAAEEIWMDANRASEMNVDAAPEAFYSFYQQHCSMWIDVVEDRLHQAFAPPWLPPALSHLGGKPCMVIDRVARDHQGVPVDASRLWVDCQRAHYVNRFR